MEAENLNYRPVVLAVAVATAGVLPAFLTGGLAVQVRGELDFGAGALGLAVAAFFATSSLASALMGSLVERIGSHRGMCLAAVGSATSLLGVSLFAGSWAGLVAWLGLGSTAATPLGAFIVGSSVAAGMRVGTAGLLLALGSAFGIAVRVAFGHPAIPLYKLSRKLVTCAL